MEWLFVAVVGRMYDCRRRVGTLARAERTGVCWRERLCSCGFDCRHAMGPLAETTVPADAVNLSGVSVRDTNTVNAWRRSAKKCFIM